MSSIRFRCFSDPTIAVMRFLLVFSLVQNPQMAAMSVSLEFNQFNLLQVPQMAAMPCSLEFS